MEIIIGREEVFGVRKRLGMALLSVLWLLLSCTGRMEAQTRPDLSVVGKVSVTASGTVSLDGSVVTLDVLKQRLAELKKRNGLVWYYRETGRGDAPPQATQILKLIIDNQLPVSLSTKPDFSDVLLPDGTTRPRVQSR